MGQHNVQELYQKLRQTPDAVFKGSPGAVISDLKNNNPGALTGFDPKQGITAYFIAGKVAKNCDLADFEAFIKSGEAPAIQLSNDEMEVLKGGGWGDFFSFRDGGIFTPIYAVVDSMSTNLGPDANRGIGRALDDRNRALEDLGLPSHRG